MNLSKMSDDQLLDLRFNELPIGLDNPLVLQAYKSLCSELKRRQITIKPHLWISTEWFSPDGVNGIAIPFYLFHPRLKHLHQKLGYEVEGRTLDHLLKLFRHEMGHVMDNAYALRRVKGRKQVFGGNDAYPEDYRPTMFSKKFVKNLSDGYAQAHPEEDWAETFAVWLTPKNNWKKKYKNWPALEKLTYMDQLLSNVTDWKIGGNSKRKVDCISRNKNTLRDFYSQLAKARKRELKVENNNLSQILLKNSKDICVQISKQTGLYQYQVKRIISSMKYDKNLSVELERRMPLNSKDDIISLLSKKTMVYYSQGADKVYM